MALKRFGDMAKSAVNKWQNKVTDSLVNDVEDQRNDEFKSQLQNARKKNDNLSLWDKYKRTDQKIDVPGFDAQIVDLPKEDENEKEIVVDRTPKAQPYSKTFTPNTEKYDLEALAGNGLPVEEEPIPQEQPKPEGTSFNIPKEENPEWDLEDLAGNGLRTETPANIENDDTVVGEPTLEENAIDESELDDTNSFTEEEPNEDKTVEEDVPQSVEEEDLFDENEVVEPEDTEAPDIPTDEEINQPTEEPKKEEPPAKEKKKGEEENKDNKEKEEDDGEKEPKEKEKVKTDAADVKDNIDLVKKGSGVSVNDMVDRSQIPHYNYLSFFQ
jgi:hypothetical protein